MCRARPGRSAIYLDSFPTESVRVAERLRVAVHHDAVRPGAVRGDTGVLGEPGSTWVERQLDTAGRRVELDVAPRETALQRQTTFDIEPLGGAQIRGADEQHQVVDLPR